MPVSQVPASNLKSLTYQDNSWSGCRTSIAGTVQLPGATRDVWIKKQAGRGGTIYDIARSFAIFDTSAFAGTITAVDLVFDSLGSPNTLMNVIAVESTAYGGSPTGPISSTDYSALNWAQTYTAQTSIPFGPSPGLTFAGNASFISLANTGTANIAIINGQYDQQDIDPAGQIWTEIYVNIDDLNPALTYLNITHTAAGYGNDVNGVASADISSINAVATADIFEVNGA